MQHSCPSYRVAASSRIHATILSTCAGGLFRSTCVFGVFGLAKCWPKVVNDTVVVGVVVVVVVVAAAVAVAVVVIIIIRITIIWEWLVILGSLAEVPLSRFPSKSLCLCCSHSRPLPVPSHFLAHVHKVRRKRRRADFHSAAGLNRFCSKTCLNERQTWGSSYDVLSHRYAWCFTPSDIVRGTLRSQAPRRNFYCTRLRKGWDSQLQTLEQAACGSRAPEVFPSQWDKVGPRIVDWYHRLFGCHQWGSSTQEVDTWGLHTHVQFTSWGWVRNRGV